jgi:hypothetical protein
MNPLPIASQLITKLLFSRDPQRLVREQVHPQRRIDGCIAEACQCPRL